ncbi:MAG TPA: choice-of-anchor Q domain-containing protein [Chthoniobacterales bacterium]|jgi:hypothetical protein
MKQIPQELRRRRNFGSAALRLGALFLTAAAFFHGTAWARNIVVTSYGDEPVTGKTTLREAIAMSAAGDVITFAVGHQVILTQKVAMSIDHDLTIQGPQVGTQTVQRYLSAVGARFFTITAGNVTLSHLALRFGTASKPNGTAGHPPEPAEGGAIYNSATLAVNACLFDTNEVNGGLGAEGMVGQAGGVALGGAIYNSGALTARSCTFSGNEAPGGGGGPSTGGAGPAGGDGEGAAIYNAGTALITNCSFQFNFVSGGHGGQATRGYPNGKGGDAEGGAIANAGVATILSNTFANNGANGGPAGFSGTLGNLDGGGAFGGAVFCGNGAGAVTTIRSSLAVANLVFGGTSSNYGYSKARGPADGPNVYGLPQSAGFNLIAIGDGSSGWTGSDQIGTTAAPIDPKLQQFLHDDGGPVMTFSLAPGSPAIDKGKSAGLSYDERGLARVYDDPAVPNAAGGDGSDIGAFELQPAPRSDLQNVSTRAKVGVGTSVLIGGIIITGQESKTMVFRAIGTDLDVALPTLPDPVLELHGANGDLIASNDNWSGTPDGELELHNLAPNSPTDSALLITLRPADYTVVVHGKGNDSGLALVEAYDISPYANSALANLSTRGHVAPGDDALIGGFILGGGGGGLTNIGVRALGPSLGLGAAALKDPTLSVYDGNGVLLASNDNWKQTQQAAIIAAGLAPGDDRESALIISLPPDDYTAVVSGKDDASGIALVEIYRLP